MSHNVWLSRLKDSNLKFNDENPKSFKIISQIALGVVLIGVGIKTVTKIIEYRKKRQRIINSLSKPDVVILHQFPRGRNVPNISPFVLKLESYLRLAKITYENDHRDFMGPKGKCPYITLNGEDIADSQLIIEHLNKVFKVDLNRGLSNEQKAIGRAFRIMLEDHLYWANCYYLWVLDEKKTIEKLFVFPFPLKHFGYNMVRCLIKKSAWYQGIGRHSKEEIIGIAKKDILALSYFLGEKKFLFGDNPTEEDCAVFGILAQCLWTFPGSFIEALMNGECRNLKSYCLRMKTEVWPDWDKCIKPITT